MLIKFELFKIEQNILSLYLCFEGKLKGCRGIRSQNFEKKRCHYIVFYTYPQFLGNYAENSNCESKFFILCIKSSIYEKDLPYCYYLIDFSVICILNCISKLLHTSEINGTIVKLSSFSSMCISICILSVYLGKAPLQCVFPELF